MLIPGLLSDQHFGAEDGGNAAISRMPIVGKQQEEEEADEAAAEAEEATSFRIRTQAKSSWAAEVRFPMVHLSFLSISRLCLAGPSCFSRRYHRRLPARRRWCCCCSK